ncbi:MAG: hypothetical protein MK116_04800 [Phycisphaerales bacterium]|nr:hypothetical protein [Phycisphaerales bacterium]
MHILTKIFIVLITLLAVFLVPLVVVSAKNQVAWKTKAMQAEADREAARQQLTQARSNHQAEVARLSAEASDFSQRLASLDAQLTGSEDARRSMESDLFSSRTLASNQAAVTRSLTKSLQASTDLTQGLVSRVGELRTRALTAEERRVELDEALRDLNSRLETAIAAHRALEEEINLLKDEKENAKSRIAAYVARFGALEDQEMDSGDGLAPDRTLDATVLDVRRLGDRTLAEIDAGSRDGVKPGWVMTVGDNGIFIGRLRITHVDINRSTGVVTLEDPDRGMVETGQRAYALIGQN